MRGVNKISQIYILLHKLNLVLTCSVVSCCIMNTFLILNKNVLVLNQSLQHLSKTKY
jgi:hypothetical protein